MPEDSSSKKDVVIPTASVVLAAFMTGRSMATQEVYRRDLRAFASFCRKGMPELIEILMSPQTGRERVLLLVRSFRDDMRCRGLAPGTVGRRLAAIRGISRTARVLGFLDWSLPVDLDSAES